MAPAATGSAGQVQPCYLFGKTGSCRFGADCRDSQDSEVMAQAQALLCRQFARGKCSRGDKCPFRHVAANIIGTATVASAVAALGAERSEVSQWVVGNGRASTCAASIKQASV